MSGDLHDDKVRDDDTTDKNKRRRLDLTSTTSTNVLVRAAASVPGGNSLQYKYSPDLMLLMHAAKNVVASAPKYHRELKHLKTRFTTLSSSASSSSSFSFTDLLDEAIESGLIELRLRKYYHLTPYGKKQCIISNAFYVNDTNDRLINLNSETGSTTTTKTTHTMNTRTTKKEDRLTILPINILLCIGQFYASTALDIIRTRRVNRVWNTIFSSLTWHRSVTHLDLPASCLATHVNRSHLKAHVLKWFSALSSLKLDTTSMKKSRIELFTFSEAVLDVLPHMHENCQTQLRTLIIHRPHEYNAVTIGARNILARIGSQLHTFTLTTLDNRHGQLQISGEWFFETFSRLKSLTLHNCYMVDTRDLRDEDGHPRILSLDYLQLRNTHIQTYYIRFRCPHIFMTNSSWIDINLHDAYVD